MMRLSKVARKALKRAYKQWKERGDPWLSCHVHGVLSAHADEISGREWARLAWWLMLRHLDDTQEALKRFGL